MGGSEEMTKQNIKEARKLLTAEKSRGTVGSLLNQSRSRVQTV